MKTIAFSLRAGAVALVLAAGNSPPTALARDDTATVAAAGGYAEFRKLAVPLGLLDRLNAMVELLAARHPYALRHSAKWRSVFVASFKRHLAQKSDDVTDAIMRPAFLHFTPAEVTRLTAILQKPGFAKFAAAAIESIRLGQQGTEADFKAQAAAFPPLSDDDSQLLGRFLDDILKNLQSGMNAAQPVFEAAFAEADATAP